MKTFPPALRLIALFLLLAANTARSQTIELVRDVNTTPPSASTHVESMIFAAGQLFISADDPVSGSELWAMSIPSSFNTPSAAAVDVDGNVYVVDTPNHTIRRITPAGMVSTYAGRPGVSGGTNGAGLSATFNAPEGIAVDALGNVYVADTGNHVIRRINRDGIVSTLAGQVGTLGTNNGTGENARFRTPRGVTVNNAGTLLYVADSGNHTLRRVVISVTTPASPTAAEVLTATVTVWAGTAGSTGTADGTGSAARFNNPTALSIDNAGFLYVSDTGNHTLRRVNTGGTVTTLAGTAGTAGSQNGTGAAASFSTPRGIAVEPGGTVAYVCDSGNHLVRRVTSAGVVTTLAGQAGVAGYVNGAGTVANFSGPRGIAFRSGVLHVGDTQNHVVRTVATASGLAGLFAGRAGVPGSGDGSAVATGGATPSIIKDIYPGAGGSAPAKLTSVGNRLFFTALDATEQRDLWVTDGTAGNTRRVTTSAFYPNPPGEPENLVDVNGTLYFTGYSSQEGLELWKATVATNGTATAALVKDVNPESGQGSASGNYFNAGGTLLFRAFDGPDPDNNPATAPNGTELWKSNGTSAGTTLLADLFPGSSDSNPSGFTSFGGFVYFTAQGVSVPLAGEQPEPVGRELFRSALPGLGSVQLVSDIALGGTDSDPQNYVISGSDPTRGGSLYFTASTLAQGRELWVLNGAGGLNSPTLVRDLYNGPTDAGISNMTPILDPVRNVDRPYRVLFTADDNTNIGTELFSSDGTVIGTVLVEDLTSGTESSNLSNFIQTSPGWVIFTRANADGDLTLYSTNGQSLEVIEDFLTETTGTPSASPRRFRSPVQIGTHVFFLLGDDELWCTDGISDAGTFMVHRFRRGSQGSDARDFTRMSDGRIIFSAVTPARGRELWITDTHGVTTPLPEVVTGAEGGDPMNLTATTDGRVFFTAVDTETNRELWVTNGTAVTKVKEINAVDGSQPDHLFWHQPTSGQGRLYFAAVSSGNDLEPWMSDGTDAGTVRLLDVNPGTPPSLPGPFRALGNTVFFAASRSSDGRELWKTEGTEASTARVMDISVGSSSSEPADFNVMTVPGQGQRLFFSARGVNSGNPRQHTGRELWVTDGREVGTVVVRDIILGLNSALDEDYPNKPSWLTVSGGRLFFVADDGRAGRELWMSTGVSGVGTSGNASLVKDIRTTTSGTPGITLGSEPSHLVNANGRLFFLADEGVNGRELWTSTGTAASTVMVRNIAPGSASPDIRDMIAVGDIVCFTADDGVSGREVWVSDGTAGGTFMLEDLLPGDRTSTPSALAGFGTSLYLSAADPLNGMEPRMARLPARLAVEQPLGSFLATGTHTVDFTPLSPLSFGAAGVTVQIRLSNAGISPLKNLAATISGRHAADFKITSKKLPPTLTAAAPFLLEVQFLPREGGTREAALTILSSDETTPIFVMNLSGVCSKDPTVTAHPASQVVKVGQPVVFSATATGTAPLAVQWRRNNGVIAGASSNPLYLWSAQLKDAGAYTALFSNSVRPGGSALTDAAQLLVVEDFSPPRVMVSRVGGVVTLTANAAGSISTYSWSFSGGAIPNATGLNTRTLTLRNVQAGQSGTYSCVVTGPAGSESAGTTELRIFTTHPVITPTQVMRPGVVGAFYRDQILVSSPVAETPQTFSASPLPPGLRLDARTGVISGRPTRAGSYTINISASNGIRPTATPDPTKTTATIIIAEMPAGLDGTYTGLAARQDAINSGAGGRLDITITRTGSFSGALVQGGDRLPVSGNLEFAVNNTVDPPVAAPPFNARVVLSRRGIATPVTLDFEIKSDTKDRLVGATLTTPTAGGAATAAIVGWKAGTTLSPYVSTSPYNFGLRLPDTVNSAPNPNLSPPKSEFVPQGMGFASFTIATRGTLNIAGQTSDGERITCSSFVGPDGEVLLYQSLYTTTRKGSLQGVLRINKGANDASPADNTVEAGSLASMDWVRPPATAALSAATPSRTYRAGFGLGTATPDVTDPVLVEPFGGLYERPAALLKADTTVPVDTDNASLAFAGANVPTTRVNVPGIYINSRSIIKNLSGPATTTVSATPATGAFSGGFVLEDDDVTTTTRVNPKEVRRAIRYQGLIVPAGTDHRGVGFFMLPQLPAVPTDPPANRQPLLSGSVLFEKG